MLDEEGISMLAERLKRGVESRKHTKHLPNKISKEEAEQLIRMYLNQDLGDEKQKEIESILDYKKEGDKNDSRRRN